MSLVSLRGVSFGFGGPPLLTDLDLQIQPAERICLIGRNGEGKTTLLRLIAGELEPDDGVLTPRRGLRRALMPQGVPEGVGGTVAQVVAGGIANPGDEWESSRAVDAALAAVELSGEADFVSLSGGMQRRALLARALVDEPDLLLLDEPTNHLDIDAIDWLERFCLRWSGTVMFVTHDRMFVGRLATRILEIDRGRLSSWPGDHATYLERKAAALSSEAAAQAVFDKRLAEEERWIRQGIKARRTRNEGRVKRLEQMRAERGERRARPGQVKLALDAGARSGRLVLKAEDVSYRYDDGPPVISHLTTTILRGDRVGLIGPNGSGKTTLLKLLVGELAPQAGTIRHGTELQIAVFDQLREALDPDATVLDNVGQGRDVIEIGGRSRPVLGYLQDFLFSPERARTQVRFLSGGERNRVMLARLLTRPANLLVLDEPTNDLDVETLELLEDLLLDFPGTLLLVSHDRQFLDNVVTSTLVLEGDGKVGDYVGGYTDWLRQRPAPAEPVVRKTARKAPVKPRPQRPAKLSYREQQELAGLPEQIDALESEQAELTGRTCESSFYQQPGEAIAVVMDRLKAVETELATAYARWESLAERDAG